MRRWCVRALAVFALWAGAHGGASWADPTQDPSAVGRRPDLQASVAASGGRSPLAQTEVQITGITPSRASPGQYLTIQYAPAVDIRGRKYSVVIGSEAVEVIGDAPGALDVTAPSSAPASDRVVPVRLVGDVYTRRPFVGLTLASTAISPTPEVVKGPWPNLQTLVGGLGAVSAALAGVGIVVWTLWNQRRRELSLKAEMFRMQERLRQAEAPAPASGDSEPWASAMPNIPETPFATAATVMDPLDAIQPPDPDEPQEPTPAPEPPDELVQAVASGGCVLFLGSGISAQAGLPTWSQFIDGFLTQLEREEPKADWAAVRAQFSRRAVRVVADLIESRGKGERLARAVRDTYGGPVQAPPWLTRFMSGVHLAGLLTTNFDRVADDAAKARAPVVLGPMANTDFGALLRENRFFLMKLHGDPADPSGAAAFTVEHLWRALEERPDLRGFLGTLFASRTLFFAGFDPSSIEGFLTAIGARAGSVRHFALAPEDGDTSVLAESFQGRFNLELLPFRPSSGYPQTPEFFDRLAAGVAAAQAAQPELDAEARAKTAPMQLSRVRLVNIGPFEDAAFELSPRWTVLLGDNGCGKSTVLRAVALALCGADDEAARLAKLLLRHGAEVQSGSIELTMASNPPTTYTVDLRRTRDGVAVSASAYGPLQSGTMVALGFPALRGVVPGQAPAAASDGMNFPRVHDVTPLIRGGIDARVSNLRGWIRDNYARSQDSKLPAKQRARYDAMLKKLFQLIDDMIPGFEIRLSRYDTVANEVLLNTPDGELPMDYVSQGMSSTIGWLGVLVQRLYEIYPRTNHPEQEHALLLIDEMDSHLHPEWQRVLAPNIKKHFPNVQVIATTHSPLVVANMEAGEVIRVLRWGDEIEVQHMQQSFSGYRADQVLTAEAFGLASTRSVAWEELRGEYAALLAKSIRTPAEQARMDDLAREIEGQSARGRSPEQNAAAAAVRETLTKQAEALDWGEESKRKTLEAAVQRLEQLSATLPGAAQGGDGSSQT